MMNVLFFLLGSTLIFCGAFARGRAKSIFVFSLLFVLVFYAGLRGDVGQDTYSYGLIYQDSLQLLFSGIRDLSFDYEPLFLLLTSVHKYYFGSPTFFFFTISLVQVFLLWFCSKDLHHRWVFLSVYLFSFYFDLHFNVLRAGLAILFFLCAISSKSKLSSFLFLILAPFFQVTVFFLFPVYFYKFMPSRFVLKLVFFLVFFVLFCLVFLLFQDYIFLKLRAYEILNGSNELVLKDFSVFRLVSASLMLVLGGYVFFFLKSGDKEIKVSYFLLVVSAFVMAFYPIFFRVYSLSLLVFVFLCCRFISFKAGGVKWHFLVAITLAVWQSYGSVSYIFTHYQIVSDEDSVRRDFSVTDYEFYFDSEYR